MSRRHGVDWGLVGGVAFLAFMLLAIVVSVWAQIFAPCEYVDWMPVKDVPARCL